MTSNVFMIDHSVPSNGLESTRGIETTETESSPVVRGRIPASQLHGAGSILAGSGILISNLILGECPLEFCPAMSLAVAMLITDRGNPVLVLLSSVLVHSLVVPIGI